jgi:hypothetical protein
LEKRKHNPIDEDKIAENPHLLPYAHTLGGAIIKPLDKGRIKGLAMSAMYEQTGDKLNQIKEQIDLLVQQAQDIHDRIDLSEKIYEAKYSFKPIIGQQYFLYQQDEEYVLSMISPTEWGKKGAPYEYLASAKVLSDHTWEITDMQKQDIDIEL